MKREMLLRPEVRRAIGMLGLPREALLDLFLCIHRDVARDYGWHRQFRADDPLQYNHRIFVTLRSGEEFQITIVVDDTTLPDHLVIVDVDSKLF